MNFNLNNFFKSLQNINKSKPSNFLVKYSNNLSITLR